MTPLHLVAANGRVEVVRVVLEHGANVGAEDDECGTPLYAAADYGRLEVVRVLIERGESIGTER